MEDGSGVRVTAQFADRIREEREAPRTIFTLRFVEVVSCVQLPNKAPEPTRATVTPRAIEMKTEMKPLTTGSLAARGAPVARVAHL